MIGKLIKKYVKVVNIILVLAASFAAYNFGLAGGYIEGTKFSLGGLLAGVVVNLSLVVGASKYGSVTGKKRTKQATVSLVALLLLSPAMVSPVIFYKLPDTFMNIPLRVAWSIGWPLAADIAIVVAGAVAGKGLVRLGETQSVRSTSAVRSQSANSANEFERSTSAVRSQCEELATQYACSAPLCEWKPDVDKLVQAAQEGKDPKRSASSAKAGHVKNQHAKIEVDLFVGKDGGS